jgi:hypothetical protein
MKTLRLDRVRSGLACCVAAIVALLLGVGRPGAQSSITRFPTEGARNVSPDTHLVLTFPTAPTLGTSGQIRIYDAADNRLVDTLDLSIPPGPTAGVTGPRAPYTPTPYEYTSAHPTNADTVPGTPSGAAVPTSRDYQLTIIGGFSDGFHFYPVIVHDRVATIYPHHNLLRYNKTYYVQIDPGVLTLADGSFNGIGGRWQLHRDQRYHWLDLHHEEAGAAGDGLARGRRCRWQRRLHDRAGCDRLRSRSQSTSRHDLHSQRQLRGDRLFP